MIQLILECKEVVAGGIITLQRFQDLTDVISSGIKAKMKARQDEFDDDLKSILNVKCFIILLLFCDFFSVNNCVKFLQIPSIRKVTFWKIESVAFKSFKTNITVVFDKT